LYTSIIREAGFREITLHKQKVIDLPEAILLNYLNEKELTNFRTDQSGIFSITISARKFEDLKIRK
jgi:hypothetical protein